MKKKIFNSFISLIFIILLISTVFNLIISKYFEKEYHNNENRIISDIMFQLGNNVTDVSKNIETLLLEDKYLVLYDKNGEVVKKSFNLPHYLSNINLISNLFEGESIIKVDEFSNANVFTKRLDGGYFLRIYSISSIKDNISSKFVKFILVTFFVLFIVALFFTNYIVNNIIAPLKELSEATQRVAYKDLSSRIKISKNEELSPIVENFNVIADKLENTILDFFEKENQLDAILSSMNSGVIAVDKDGKIIIFNKFSKKLFGIYGEVIGKNLSEVLEYLDIENLLTVDEEFKELEIGNFDPIHLRYKTTALIGDNNKQTGKVTVLSDVTDLKKLEQMRTQFVANVSHELKTPLTSIKGFSETLRDVHDENIKNKFLDIIDAESERLRRLIDDILSLSSIENQKEINVEIVNALEVTKEACKVLEHQAKTKKIDFSLITKGNPLFIGDIDKYKQLVINLVDNAIKYTEPNNKVIVRLEEYQRDFLLSVNDSGIGIPKEHIPRLFERFYRVDKSRDRAKGGTGLGLAIVKHIVLGFKGTIEVESEVGKGTKFIIHIPVYRDDENKVINTKIESYKFS